MDILGISEVRWTGQGCMRSDGKTILFSGLEERHERGVGIVLSKRAAEALVGWRPVSERIITARFVTRHTRITVVQVYAPTEDTSEELKDSFYEQLQDIVDDVPRRDLKLIIGDFNAKLSQDRTGFERAIGPFASCEQHSNNGERLALFCEQNAFCVGNTFFQHKRIHKETWCSPDGKTRKEIDYICISKKWRTSLRDVRVFRGADVASDHLLLGASIKLKLKRQVEELQVTRPFALEKLKDPAITACFPLELRNRFAVLEEVGTLEEEWTSVKRAIQDCAQEVLGRRRGKRKEQWIQGSTWEKIDERKRWKLRREQAKNENELEVATSRYAELDRIVKRSRRRDKKALFSQKGTEAQHAAERGDLKTLHRIVNELIGSSKKVNLPIKDSKADSF
uniref:Endonuclease exonuclease phosphatase domain containing protein n=1 Tax=Haemonchus contortus TaxID=6289 RepID=W6NF69_HAECO